LFIIIINIWIIYYTKLGNLLDTFCSLNANKNAQSAGNLCLVTKYIKRSSFIYYGEERKQGLLAINDKMSSSSWSKKGSSETIRGNTYDLFKLNFAYYFNEEFSKDDN
jgi:hypothetical protein